MTFGARAHGHFVCRWAAEVKPGPRTIIAAGQTSAPGGGCISIAGLCTK